MSADIAIVLIPVMALLVSGVVFAIGYFAKDPEAATKKPPGTQSTPSRGSPRR
jgi:hypothetical protein